MAGVLFQRLPHDTDQFELAKLREALEQQGIYLGTGVQAGRVAFLFPGHGAQYPAMMRDLAARYPVVEETFSRADAIYRELAGETLSGLVFSWGSGGEEQARDNLKRAEVMQPAIFTASMAMYYLVHDLGLRADVLLGHSLGEYAALAAGGGVSFTEGLRAVFARACAVNGLNPARRGAMVSVQADGESGALEQVLAEVKGYFSKSIVNSPTQLVISGEQAAVTRIQQLCRERGMAATILPVSHAFHSDLMAAAVAPLERGLRAFNWSEPGTRVLSSISGDYYDRRAVEAMPSFLARQLTTPFNFRALLLKAYDAGVRVFIEVGPRNILSRLVRDNLGGDVLVSATNVPSLGGLASLRRLEAFSRVHGLSGSGRELQTVQSPTETRQERGVNSEMRNAALVDQLVEIVSKKTGYPRPLIRPEKKLMTELGMSFRVYQGLLQAIGQEFPLAGEEGVPAGRDLTLQEIGDYLARQASGEPDGVAEKAGPARVERWEIEEAVRAAIGEKTGYPLEMLEPDLDLEADLGIDSVKQAEIFGRLRERYGLVTGEEVQLKDLQSINKIVDFVFAQLSAAASPRPGEVVDAAPAATAPLDAVQVMEVVLALVVEKTGYPAEMLEPDLDLEADLGIDSVKQAEVFGQLRERFGLPEGQDVQLKELNTLNRLVAFLLAAARGTPGEEPQPAEQPPLFRRLDFAEEGEVALRYVPLTVEQPFPASPRRGLLAWQGKRILVLADRGGEVARRLIPELRARGALVYAVIPAEVEVAAEECFPASFAEEGSWQAALAAARARAGGIEVVVNLYPLFGESSLFEGPVEQWEREVDQQFDVNFLACREVYADLQDLPPETGGYFAATNMGACFCLEAGAGGNPLGGITSGFVKSLRKELPHLAAKVVDFPTREDPETIARLLLQEMELLEEYTELGYANGTRKTIQVLPVELRPAPQQVPLVLDRESVVLVTGGGRGIVFECLQGLLALCQPHIVLTGRTVPPAGDEEWLHLDEAAFTAYRQEHMKRLKRANPALTPLLAERESRKLEYARKLHRNLQELRRLNANVHYEVCDVADREQVRELVERVKSRLGRIDGVIHGASLESFAAVPKKPLEHSRNVVRVKVNGYRNLWETTRGEPLRFFVNFGSISGRFGMDGQVDYCAGADALAKCSHLHSRTAAPTRFFTIDWTAWADTGMGAYDFVRHVQEEKRGLAYLPVAEGVRKFLRELFFGGLDAEVMFFGALGTNSPLGQLASLDEQCRRVVFPARADGLVIDRVRYPLLERVTEYEEAASLKAEKRLHPREDLYLADHLVNGASTFPGVMHVEAHCQAAALLCPGHFPAELRDVEFMKFVKCYQQNPLTLKVQAAVRHREAGEAEVAVEIRTDFVNSHGVTLEQNRLHSQGIYLLRQDRPPAPPAPFDVQELLARGARMDLEKFYQRAARSITFGATFRALREVRLVEEGLLVSETVVPPNRGLFSYVSEPRFLTGPVVIDNACRATLLWAFHHTGKIVVPRRIGETSLYRAPYPGERVYACSRFVAAEDEFYHFQVQLVDAGNKLLVDMPRLVMVQVSHEPGDTSLL